MSSWIRIGDLIEGLGALRKEVGRDILPLPTKEIDEFDGSTIFKVRMPVTGVIETVTEREAVFFGRRRLKNAEHELLLAVQALVVRDNPLNLEDCASHLRMSEKWLKEAAGYIVGSRAFATEVEMFRLCIDVMIDRLNKLPISKKMPNAYDRFCDHLHEVFADREAGRAYLEDALWPAGPRCPYCKGDNVRRSTRRERKSEQKSGHKLMLYRPHWCRTCERPFKVTDRTPLGRHFYPEHLSARAALVIANFSVRQALLAQAVGVHVTVVRVFRERMRTMDLRPFGIEVLDPAVIRAWAAHASRAGRRITLASATGSSLDGTSSRSART
ncbi:MAG: transposase [Acidobacteria bacterium]|nr:transposase [Acidobacteriota bacterium]